MIFNIIADIVSEKIECDVNSIKMESNFKDLGIDSLDTVEMIMKIEDKIGQEIELNEKIETVGELVDFIEKNYKI